MAIPDPLVLPEGTPVSLELLTLVTTRTAKRNDRVKLQVVSDVSVEGLAVIRSGSVAWGTVVITKKPGRFSRDGKLQIELQSVTLLNGQPIAIHQPIAFKPHTKWDWRAPDSLQAPLLIPVGAAILTVSSREDQEAFFVSVVEAVFAKGHHIELLPGTRMEVVVSRRVNLNRDEFGILQLRLLD